MAIANFEPCWNKNPSDNLYLQQSSIAPYNMVSHNIKGFTLSNFGRKFSNKQ